MYADYTSFVLSKYKNGCKEQQLSPNLSNPTPGNLRAECVIVCGQRFDSNDQRILRTFFGQHNNQKAYIHAIEVFDVDQFKPLSNYIAGKTKGTKEKNIELLAWLIDVQPRPYRDDFSYLNTNTQPAINKNNVTAKDTVVSLEISQAPNVRGLFAVTDARNNYTAGKAFLNKHSIVIAVLVLLMFLGSYWLWNSYKHSGGCMYWADDHYELVDCDKKMGKILVVAADNNLLSNFRKITRKDTITAKALGHVWYSKINNEIEYFTADGYHPVMVRYHLKPLTQYIIQQHLTLK